MSDESVFDVMVVYSNLIAMSANNLNYTGRWPFPTISNRSNYNLSYAYFLAACRRAKLTAAFSTSADIIGPGQCKSYWLYQQKTWTKVRQRGTAQQIFDKISPVTRKKKLEWEELFASSEIEPFNNLSLVALFMDKYQTYKKLARYSFPTVALTDTSFIGIRKAVSKLRKLTAGTLVKTDYTDAIVMKDRFGAGGNNIFRITKNVNGEIKRLCQENKEVSFVLQPYLRFKKGYHYRNYTQATDIRLIYQNGIIIQTYIRMAKANDFRCNLHQGGKLIYVDIEAIPNPVIAMAEKIVEELGYKRSLFTLDFIVSDSGRVYFIEGNMGPGINWDLTNIKDEQMSKKLIVGIVEEIAFRVKRQKRERYAEVNPEEWNDFYNQTLLAG